MQLNNIERWNEHAYIRTFSGGYFYPKRVEELSPSLVDIAHALSLVCRYNGHLKWFYSVAQHSMIVEEIATERMLKVNRTIDSTSLRKFRTQALLHDATEAYLPDMPSPIKQFLPDFKVLEKKLQQHIYRSFALPENTHAIIKEVDTQIRISEMRCMQDWEEGQAIVDMNEDASKFIFPMESRIAEQRFLNRYYEINE